jgi:predicted ATPase/class 3 adenylate cyclase/DNA-binding CsgD family transcriptional regulator
MQSRTRPGQPSLGHANDAGKIPVLPTGTVTFLFTDIEGSTGLWDQHPNAARTALARHDSIIEALVAKHSGVVVRPRGEGDSRFAVFRSASEALAAACGIQQAIIAESWPTPTPLHVRIALHTGEADVRDGDYYGGAVNRCARLRGVAHGGQTLLSGVTAEIVRDELPDNAWLLDLGMHRLKDLAAAEHVFQLAHPTLLRDFPPLRSLTTQLHNLPVQLSSFVGRERELADVAKLLASNRQLTLTGTGGAGKTRLALQVAAELVGDYADGVWLVDLAPLADPTLVPQAIASVLGMREQAGHSFNERLTNFLHSKQLLVVLDNSEHLVQACADVTEKLLGACPGIKILATSREQLAIVGEIVWRVPSLDVPRGPSGRSLDAVAASSAVRLFVDRAQAVEPGFQLDAANAASVAEICERLDGIPLALELAAARLQVLSAAQIATRLSDCLRLLVSGRRTAPSRQQTLRATFDWSYQLLSRDEQLLLERLAIFAGGFTLGAAEVVCGVDGINSGDVLDLLSRLIAKSLVVVEPDADRAPRYRLHVPLREYLIERLTVGGELERMRRRHAHHFVSLAEQADAQLRGSRHPREGLEGLQTEYDNLRAALRWCGSNAETDFELRLAVALTRFWRSRGYLTEGRAWLSAALAHNRHAPGAIRARALDDLSSLASDQADDDAAEALALECLQIRRDLDDRSGVAEILQDLGILARKRGDRARARQLYDELLTIARELGAVKQIASGLVTRAAVHVDDGCLERATSDVQEAGSLLHKLDGGALAYCLQRLGAIALLKGDYVGLRTHCEQAVAIFRERGEKVFITSGLLDLGRGAYETRDFPRARALLDEALALARELQAPHRIARALQSLGALSLAQGDLKMARELLEQCRAIRDIGEDAGIINPTLFYLARIARAQGDFLEACTLYRKSLELFSEVTARHQGPRHFEDVGALIVSLGQPLTAARLFGAADQSRTSLCVPIPPVDKAEYDRAVADARAAGGRTAFEREWAAGAALSIENALACAHESLDILLSRTGQEPEGSRRPVRQRDVLDPLTAREREVATLLVRGCTNSDIASSLCIAPSTAERHVANILAKLGIRSRTEVAVWVVQHKPQVLNE